MLTQLATWLWCCMHAVWADNNSWISNVDIVHAENCGGQSDSQTNTLCPTKMYGTRSTVSVYSAFCTCHASMTITTCVHIHTCTHTLLTHTHTHYILTCTHTHTHTCTHKHTGMNKKKLEDNLFAHCVSLVLLFNFIWLCCFREHAVAESSFGTFWFAGSVAFIMWLFIDVLVRSTT